MPGWTSPATASSRGAAVTGGKGGDQVDAPADSLASQGSLVYDDASGMLLAVNAGSGTVTAFRARERSCWVVRWGGLRPGGRADRPAEAPVEAPSVCHRGRGVCSSPA
ncbi:hypothetical protein [Streptomyces stelliscabiei]|uniref:hypothetical protein n=1 Tax=Streptomyces stelliscabiei TaxID=146820 RepID=UPI002FF37932